MGRIQVDHVAEATEYAHEIVAGLIPACKWVKAACQRQLDDLARAERATMADAGEAPAFEQIGYPGDATARAAAATATGRSGGGSDGRNGSGKGSCSATAAAATAPATLAATVGAGVGAGAIVDAVAATGDAPPPDSDWPFVWRPDLADRVIRFVELLPHVKGPLAGEAIRLEPWQKFGLACVFGWVRKSDGLRRFRTVYEEVPRTNAKTTKLAPIGLYMLTADGEFGAEVYSAATKEEQARIVFEIAQQMARMEPEFRATFGVDIYNKALAVRSSASKFRPLAADANSLDGLNVSCALIDELHAHKTRAVHDVLDSATGSRSQPLIWKITTAGSNRAGVCYDQRNYLVKILNSVLKRHGGLGYKVDGEAVDDEAFWGIIYTSDDGDDPFAEATWRKANPNYGISVDPEDLRRMAAMAKSQTSALNEFLTKRLDIWVNADSAWMNMLDWDACGDRSLKEIEFAGQECIAALDAAFKKDLFAKVKVFRRAGHYYVFGRYYTNADLANTRGNEHLAGWVREGWIRTTPGNVLDIEAVREELLADTRAYSVKEVPFDPAQLTQFATEMIDKHGVPMVEIRPTVLNFSPAMKELEALVAARRLHHSGDPVMAWAISNVVCHYDAKDNIYPRKDDQAKKIDPAIALVMAVARALQGQDNGDMNGWLKGGPVTA